MVSSVSTSHNVSCSRRFFYFPSFFSYNNTTASSRRFSCVPVRLKVVLDGEEREMEAMGPTSKSVNVQARVDKPLPLLYST